MDDDRPTVSSRSKTMDVTPVGEGRYRFTARLTDRAAHGNFPGDSVTIHDFGLEGEVDGTELVLRSLEVRAYAHPYGDCPFVIPATSALLGRPLTSGWRRQVLDQLGGTRGCTHVNTLLLQLSELTTMVIFLRMNPQVAYTPESRSTGAWIREGMKVAPGLSNACFGLRADGPAIAAGSDG